MEIVTLSGDCVPPGVGAIMIYLSIHGSDLIPTRVLESDSIASVKLHVQNPKGFVVQNQKVVYYGCELAKSSSLVGDYGVTEGKVLHLIVRVSDIQVITVETTGGKSHTFDVRKQLAETGRISGSFLDSQKDLFDGVDLKGHCTISEICKSDDSAIHLLIHKPAKLKTQTFGGHFEISAFATPPEKPIVVHPAAELDGLVMHMIAAACAGLENGHTPKLSSEGTGGTYFMFDRSGQEIGVFKPMDEEPNAVNNPRHYTSSTNGEGLKSGTRPGEGAIREFAAYLLDYPISTSSNTGFSGVPPTALVQCQLKEQIKVGSLQMFIENEGTSEDFGTKIFPVQEVHKIAVLDIRFANADRHTGNILVSKEGDGRIVLVPIDHGYCLPENFVDCTFDWINWPQASQPFNAETVDYIESLDVETDIKLLKSIGLELRPENARVFHISTMLLKKGAARGLTPNDIGKIMCRQTATIESKIELILLEAEGTISPSTSEEVFLKTVSKIMDEYLDEDSQMR